MDCNQVSEILFLLLDGELEPERMEGAEEHLAHCPGCARRYEYSRRVVVLVRKRCVRLEAPRSLRLRILTSLPHRRA